MVQHQRLRHPRTPLGAANVEGEARQQDDRNHQQPQQPVQRGVAAGGGVGVGLRVGDHALRTVGAVDAGGDGARGVGGAAVDAGVAEGGEAGAGRGALREGDGERDGGVGADDLHPQVGGRGHAAHVQGPGAAGHLVEDQVAAGAEGGGPRGGGVGGVAGQRAVQVRQQRRAGADAEVGERVPA